MYDEFAPGMTFPRPEDVERIARYEAAEKLYEGEHYNSKHAKRLIDKLNATRQFNTWHGLDVEGIVYLTLNLPRLICDKFADLQVLQNPIVSMDDEAAETALLERLREDIPQLWSILHEALSRKRAYGEVGLTVQVSGEQEGRKLDLRIVDPARWFPVIEPNDSLKVLAHQIAHMEDHEVAGKSVTYLRVDVCYPDRVERRAFRLEGRIDPRKHSGQIFQIAEQVDLGLHWPDLRPVDQADLDGAFSFIHLPNGHLKAGEIFGRPEFLDSGALIDDVNWRLSAWSDANDKVSHPPRIVPKAYLSQDEHGNVIVASRYTSEFIGSGRGDAEGNVPQYMTFELAYETLEKQFHRSLTGVLMRHEMSPALLGLQFGNEKESGEAKSLGMGTTEAATRRDLLQTQPQVNRALSVLARLAGYRGASVTTHWRVGLPKTQAELLAEMDQKRKMGLVTREDMLRTLYPWWTDEQIAQKLQELNDERAAEMAALTPAFSSEEG